MNEEVETTEADVILADENKERDAISVEICLGGVDDTLELVNETDIARLFTAKCIDDILGAVVKYTTSIVADVQTKKGRDDLRAMAYKVARTKTAIESAGKDAVSNLKAQVKVIDDQRKRAVTSLVEIQTDVRQPLTEWEEEDKRIKDEAKAVEALNAAHTLALIDDEIWEKDQEIKRLQKAAKDASDAANLAEIQRRSDERKKEQEATAEADRKELAQRQANLAAKNARDEEEAKSRQRELDAAKEHEQEVARVRAEEKAKADIEVERRAEEKAKQIADEKADLGLADGEFPAKANDQNAVDKVIITETFGGALDFSDDTISRVQSEMSVAISDISGISLAQASDIVGAVDAGAIPHLVIDYRD